LDEPREWLVKAIQTDQGFASIASCMMSRGTVHSFGDRVSTPHFSFNRESIDDFIGLAVAKAKCDAINFAEFPEHEEALRTLHKFLEKWLGLREHAPYDF